MKKTGFIKILPYLTVALILLSLLSIGIGSNTKEFTSNKFKQEAEKMKFGNVDITLYGVVLNVDGVYIDGKKKEVPFSVTLPKTEENIQWLDKVLNEKGKNNVSVVDGTARNVFLDIIINFLPIIFLVGASFFMFSKMGSGQSNKALDFAKSRAKVEQDIKVRFNDVAGCEEEKEEVKEVIDYLKDPQKFAAMGARVPKGILLVGPPGTGKTLLAKAVAGEADVPFYSISGSDFVEMFVGTGASRVRDMFKKANANCPCIIFIDEIDAVGRRRGAGIGGGNDEREQTLNQLLVEMDGMGDNRGIIVIAATNRSDVLDPALLRSGRFDREVMVELPDKKGRQAILEVHARNKKLDKEVDLENIAKRTPGFSGADLENVLNESAILAVRDDRKLIYMRDLDEAIDRVMSGPAKKSKVYSTVEKRRVAYHEAGHTVLGLKIEGAYIVEKVTIIPRGKAGGYNLMTPKEETYLNTKKELLAVITGTLGGRAAEELMFDDISNGATGDIQSCSDIARKMVKQYGMSELGPVLYDKRYYEEDDLCSNEYSNKIDVEVSNIINNCLKEARDVLKENKELLIKIAEILIEEETLTSEQIQNIVKFGTITNPEEVKEVVEAHVEVVEEKVVEEEKEEVKEEKTMEENTTETTDEEKK